MVAAREFRDLGSLLHPDVVLRSPVGYKPIQGTQGVAQILTAVSAVLTNFRYEREFVSKDGLNAALEFSANIADKQLKGIDILRLDENGRIVELEVMVRPFNALQALGAAMARRLGVSRFRIWLATCRSVLRRPS